MRYAANTFVISIVFALSLAGSTVSHACMAMAELVFDDIRHADIVFKGRVTGYRRTGDLLGDRAIFRFAVEETYIGKSAAELEVDWYNSTFGLPETWDKSETLIVAVSGSAKELPLRGPSATIFRKRPGKLRILQAPCAPPFIFTFTSQLVRKIEKVISH